MDKSHEVEIEARLLVVAARAHRSLTSDEISVVRQRIQRDLEQRVEMRTFPLANGDAPDFGHNSRIETGGGEMW